MSDQGAASDPKVLRLVDFVVVGEGGLVACFGCLCFLYVLGEEKGKKAKCSASAVTHQKGQIKASNSVYEKRERERERGFVEIVPTL